MSVTHRIEIDMYGSKQVDDSGLRAVCPREKVTDSTVSAYNTLKTIKSIMNKREKQGEYITEYIAQDENGNIAVLRLFGVVDSTQLK